MNDHDLHEQLAKALEDYAVSLALLQKTLLEVRETVFGGSECIQK
jgi:hypothetical protein